jgi:UDP-N-acetylglucosamine 3-dehydrogenase
MVRVVVLGVGAMGRRHVRVLAGMPDVYELIGVYDADARVAREVAREWETTAFEDERACMAAAELVVIASPIDAHARAARRAIEKGRHVLVEKPLCASTEDAFALVRAASRRSGLLFVGHSERFNPVVRALRRLVRPEDVRAISIRRATTPPERCEHGALLSLGVHDVDLVAHLTVAALDLQGVSGVLRMGDEVSAEVSLRSSTGAVARLTVDRGAARRERTIELATAREVFEGDLLEPRLFRRPRTGGKRVEVELAHVEPLAEQARAVARAIAVGGPPSVATGADGARALALALEARDWLRERGSRPSRRVG